MGQQDTFHCDGVESLVTGLCLELKSSLHTFAIHQPLMPLPTLRILLLPLLRELLSHGERGGEIVPWYKHEVCEANFVADEIGLAGFVEMILDHTQHSANFVRVSLNYRREVLFRVELYGHSECECDRPEEDQLTNVNQVFCPKYGPCPLIWKCLQLLCRYFSGEVV